MRRIGIVVTYRRPADLRILLHSLTMQSLPLDQIVVVDNDPECSARSTSLDHDYLATGGNLGPGGAIPLGINFALRTASDDDWIVLLDDDDPPSSPDILRQCFEIVRSCDSDVAAVGPIGAWYSRWTGRPQWVPDSALNGMVDVAYIGGGQLPHYRAGALRCIDLDPGLFFGFDDLDLGLRLRQAGFRLIVDGCQWHARRVAENQLGRKAKERRSSITPAVWRRYYSIRNLILIARRHGHPTAVPFLALSSWARVMGVGGLPLEARRAVIRGVMDGLAGRRGRLVEPD